jgi:outer membrane protein
MTSKLLPLALTTVALALALPACADEGPWMVRGRILDLQAKNDNDPAWAGGKVTAENKVFPEVDFSYFFTRNIAAELILTYPQAHTVSLNGTSIGSVKHLPPTLTVQYHFLPDGDVQPYVGAGLNYTRFMDVSLANNTVTVDKDSFGLAVQGGLDYRVAKDWYLNLDAKYVQIETNVKLASTGQTLTKLKIDPWLLSVGVGYRF